ncbi:hypothetical protein CNR27_01940 [Luteimonas chenhongjianii]|uniref:Uncharacterized protein n=1 Tax=Luteimonas chenhongjianii TaxID=2006110 RepID=A0A290XB86_9GAMM|nr:hypothetical protein [Luteimonas chenhongjianii]ATD66359.1 hypothetical protein CNR27_01940 [Luteimonas chenhongjianii]
MPLPPSADNPIDQDLEDTFPASDPPAHSTPSGQPRPGEGRQLSDTAWIDLYRIDTSARGAEEATLGTIADLAETGELLFGTSPALALLQHLADGGGSAPRVCLVSGRVELARLDTFAVKPASGQPRASMEAQSPLDDDAPATRPGRLVPSALSPADREVFWDAGHPDAGALSIVSRTVFNLDPRLLALMPGAEPGGSPRD